MRRAAKVAVAAAAFSALAQTGARAEAFVLDFESLYTSPSYGYVSRGADLDPTEIDTAPRPDVDNFWTNIGIKLSATDLSGNNNRNLGLFNTYCGAAVPGGSPGCTGGDNDLAAGEGLGTPNFGNALILEEMIDNANPDDHAGGGIIRFDILDDVVLPNLSLGYIALIDDIYAKLTIEYEDSSGNTYFDIVELNNSAGRSRNPGMDNDISYFLVGDVKSWPNGRPPRAYRGRRTNFDFRDPEEFVLKAFEIELSDSGALGEISFNYEVSEPGTLGVLGLGLAGLGVWARRRKARAAAA